MLRTLLLIFAAIVLLAILLVALGVVNLRQDETGRVAVETRDVEVGTATRNVQVPVVRIEERQVEVPAVGVRDEPEGNAAVAR